MALFLLKFEKTPKPSKVENFGPLSPLPLVLEGFDSFSKNHKLDPF